ncbi:glucose-6-phosphate isomerase [Ureibacillus aquaedulcis]|uniref:Glucose-6-phosphate isomerase n=1 Tax=Ureibacillus aquaedulcis TaxID=3058421 RepID=A0ABT8GUK6_9BACL|nr:glucose-6-phosphate isomerase [Ureibacillus sp. BA0131]MDN4495105.1 glucose-6-phosphate isomerase [Ureibacillus sp. BA0131]
MIHLSLTTKFNEQLFDVNFMNFTDTISSIHHHLEVAEDELTGWLKLPMNMTIDDLNAIQFLSEEIKENADVLVVIGIGGSFLGAKAVREALSPNFTKNQNGIEVLFVGHNLSGSYMKHLIESLHHRDFYVNVISKSGATLETSVAFRILRQYSVERYGQNAKQRVIVTTDPENGLLREIAIAQGFRRLDIPSNIGGRYSLLTPVGLLPISVAGINITEILQGACQAAIDLEVDDIEKNEAYRYALLRYKLYSHGYQVELLASFEPRLSYIHEWWKQLFGESEGKDKKGLFPASVNYSTDLHSLGQFIQEGNPLLFETFLHFNNISEDYYIPFNRVDDDDLNYLSHRSLNEINAISKQGTVLAHAQGGVPIIQIELEKLDAFHIGYLIYFFMKACAISAYLIDVNPFNQPGVEAYKSKISDLLNLESIVNLVAE